MLPGVGHEKTRSEIDWGRIMDASDNDGGAKPYDDGDEDDDSPHLSSVRRRRLMQPAFFRKYSQKHRKDYPLCFVYF